MRPYFYFFLGFFFLFIACNKDRPIEPIPTPTPPETTPTLDTIPPTGTTRIPTTTQRIGDQAKGREYLLTGDYVNSGPPLALFSTFFGTSENLLEREGDNAALPYEFNAVAAFNGVKVAAPNCLTCHAERLNGELIIGLGSNARDYTQNRGGTNSLVSNAINSFYGANSPEAAAYEPFKLSLIHI